jgi:hypothetical protein
MNEYEIRESVTLINENQKIFTVFHKPIGVSVSNKKIPAILICHGFAGQKTGKYRFYVTLAEELAKNGIAALRIDFRGCGDSEGDFSKTTLQAQVSDAIIALNFLKSCPEIDQNRMGICGRSLGGAVSVIAAKKFQNIKSIALLAPMFSADSWREKWLQLKKTGLAEDKNVVVMQGQLAGLNFLRELFEMRLEDELAHLKHVPLLHIHGEMDNIVTEEHASKYRDCRLEAVAKSEFLSFKQSDHDFTDLKERLEAINKTVSWFKATL